MELTTQVTKTVTSKDLNCFGKYPKYIELSNGEISKGLTERIFRYGKKRLAEIGFPEEIFHKCILSYNENDKDYFLDFYTKTDTRVTLNGILTFKGWPSIDFKFSIDE